MINTVINVPRQNIWYLPCFPDRVAIVPSNFKIALHYHLFPTSIHTHTLFVRKILFLKRTLGKRIHYLYKSRATLSFPRVSNQLFRLIGVVFISLGSKTRPSATENNSSNGFNYSQNKTIQNKNDSIH